MLSRLRTVLSRASAANCMIGCPDGAEPIGCPDGADGGCAAADLVASAQDGVERSEVAAHDVGVAAPSLEGRLVVAAGGNVAVVGEVRNGVQVQMMCATVPTCRSLRVASDQLEAEPDWTTWG